MFEQFNEIMHVLARLGYHTNSQSIEFRDSGLTLHRLWKTTVGSEDILLVALLLAQQPVHRRMLRAAKLTKWGATKIRVVQPADLITLKQARNSAADQVDIQTLKHAHKK
ncbi:MAG: hypothetical protein EPN23_03780 [Verrucomicrobia bacterium]|nr:MAG: hypothetical protein EPN23_03780 [Verrucomicrobiota bacterium]